MTPLYPVFTQLAGRAVLVVGGGAVAERKIRALLHSGAIVRVGAPELTPVLTQWVQEQRLTHYDGEFDEHWLDDVWLAIAATNDRLVNAGVRAAAEQRQRWVNVVDDPELSLFHVPAVVDRAPLVVAVSSAGVAPVLARRVRERLESLLDHTLTDFTVLLAKHRRSIRQAYPDTHARRRFYDALIDGPVLAYVREGMIERAEQALLAGVMHPDAPAQRQVSILQTDPNDPGCLTLHALRALNEADAVIHDDCICSRLLALVRRDADLYPLTRPASDEGPGAIAAELTRALTEHRTIVLVLPHGAAAEKTGNAVAEHLRDSGIYIRRLTGGQAALPPTPAPPLP